jgi:hypothetical protein
VPPLEPDSDERPKLNRLAPLAGENDERIKRRKVLENLDALTTLCLQRERHYVTKDGEERSYPDPELKTALQTQLACARLLGVDEASPSVTDDVLGELVAKARRVISRRQNVRAEEIANGEAKTH